MNIILPNGRQIKVAAGVRSILNPKTKKEKIISGLIKGSLVGAGIGAVGGYTLQEEFGAEPVLSPIIGAALGTGIGGWVGASSAKRMAEMKPAELRELKKQQEPSTSPIGDVAILML